MKLQSSLLISALGLMLSAPHAFADPVITVTPWLAPNAYGSPSFEPAAQNAIYAEMNGLTSYGAAGPTQYNVVTGPIYAAQSVVTGFNSWMGVADPGGIYASELGNRMSFGVAIVGTGGETFSISQLSFNSVSSDATDDLGFGFGAGEYDYSSDYVGVIYKDGVDTAQGVTYYTGSDNTTLVNAIYGRGSGDSEAAYCTGCTTAQEQAAIAAVDEPSGGIGYTFTGTYSLGGASGSATFNVLPDPSPTPEPSSFMLLGTGALSLSGLIRRRLIKR